MSPFQELTRSGLTSGEIDASPKAAKSANVIAACLWQLVRSAQYTESQCIPASSCWAATIATVCFPAGMQDNHCNLVKVLFIFLSMARQHETCI